MQLSQPRIFSLLLDVADREAAIDSILAFLVANQDLRAESVTEIRHKLFGREALGTTGIGNGVAMPHACHAELQSEILAVALLKEPVDWNSLDAEPVDLVFLILGRLDVSKPVTAYFHELQRQLAIGLGDRLREASSPEAVREALRKIGSNPVPS